MEDQEQNVIPPLDINLTLELNEINFICGLLAEQSYKQVAGLFAKIQQQSIPQIQAAQLAASAPQTNE